MAEINTNEALAEILDKLKKFANDVLVLGTVYLKPDIAFDVIIQNLNQELIDFRLNYGECGIIFGGDFNTRLGESNILDNDIFEGTCFKGCRQSADKEVIRKGTLLTEVMENNGLFVCNGRSYSDFPANYTFIGPQGKSVIDLVWLDFLMLKEIEIIILDQKKLANFTHALNCSENIYFNNSSVEELYNNFQGTIKSVARDVGMVQQSHRYTISLYCSEIWALPYMDIIEKIQIRFFRERSSILGNVYLPPSEDTDYCIGSLYHLYDKETKYPNCCYKIIGADFNSRIGNLNSFDEELFEGLALCGERCASDRKVNARGRLLVEMMESYGMFVINGKSPSDSP
uniref:Endonuclease/exonuclease/phosphatase domain-containing protein n=1 Tax=Rhodnius prolixus TaxID=13249 RepID=T1IG79_RHOPR